MFIVHRTILSVDLNLPGELSKSLYKYHLCEICRELWTPKAS